MHSQAKRLQKLALSPVLFLLSLLSSGAWAEEAQRWQVNMSPGVTEVGAKIYDLHMTVIWICLVIGVVLVDRMGRKFLLKTGTAGIILSLLMGAGLFYSFESKRVDVSEKVNASISEGSPSVNPSRSPPI